MGIRDLTEAQAVERAIAEYNQLGEDLFLDKYGFCRATKYHLVADGRRYASKAVAAAAHGYQHGTHCDTTSCAGGRTTSLRSCVPSGFRWWVLTTSNRSTYLRGW